MKDTNHTLRQHPVAVVGMASVFADAHNLEKYWENIVAGEDCIKEVPANRWKVEDYYDADPSTPDKTYCKVGGFLPDIDFNPMEFGLPPNLLEVTDVSQLLSLAVARDALIDAGYSPGSAELNEALRQRTGVVLGVGGGQKLITPLTGRLQEPVWRKAMIASGLPEDQIEDVVEKIKAAYIPWVENSFPGMLGNVIAGRITNRFDLGGLNSVVDAACAASLSAVKMAVSELIEGRADMMITGGVDTDNSPFMYMSFSKTPAFSRQGSIRPFDHEGDGMLIGEGIGMVVLKRLDDAVRDGDRIYAVVNGVGSSSDGRFKSIYAPRPAGQALAMNRAYEEAGYAPQTVGLIEAHGTGTNAGDAAEGESMGGVFADEASKGQHIALGSVKSQIGHTKAAAGIAGMIKAALALHHKILPCTINVTQPNPKLNIKQSPFYINTETRPWFRKDAATPRRAGVSAFGFGGINLHFAMEELNEEMVGKRKFKQHFPVLLHAHDDHALTQVLQEQIDKLQGEHAKRTLHQLSLQSEQVPAQHARLGFVAKDVDEAIKKLQTALQMLAKQGTQANWTQPIMGIWYRSEAQVEKVAALFAGQGSQYTNMGSELACLYPELRQTFTAANNILEQQGGSKLTDKAFPIPVFSEEERKAQQAELTLTQHAQPAIGSLSAGMYQLFKQAGFDADYYAGHSYGELTALWAAGAMELEEFIGLSIARGNAMAAQGNGDSGSMLAAKADEATLRNIIGQRQEIKIANINADSQVILGGATAALEAFKEELKAKDIMATMLPVSAAFHTPFVAHAQKPFAEAVAKVNFKTPGKTVLSNSSGGHYPTDVNSIRQILSDHILNPVLFKKQVEQMYADGVRVFVEFGPKSILSKLVNEILGARPHTAIALNPNAKKNSDAQLHEAAIQLAVLGYPRLNFDHSGPELPPEPPKAKISVKLGGHNYLSPGHIKKYEEALAKSFSSTSADASPVNKESINTPQEEAVEIETVTAETEDFAALMREKFKARAAKESEENMADRELLQQIQNNIDQLTQQQARIEQMLSALFNGAVAPQLGTSQEHAVLELGSAAQEVNSQISEVQNSTHQFNDPVQNGAAETAVVTPVKETVEVAAPSSNGTAALNTAAIEASLMEVIAEKTGYPSEMLELSMDMEADLGIDSIKRVEIFGAMTESNPAVQGVNPQELAELRTLQQIVDYIAGKSGATAETATPAPVAAAAPVVEKVEVAAPASNGTATLNTSAIEASLMEVIAEKTGYPAEMLELGMDLEADLGIDSIKRVEIFGAMTESNPAVQGVNPQELAELRTLQQIVDYIAGKSGATAEAAAPAPVAAASPVVKQVEVAAPASNGAATLNTSAIEASLMEVIAEKTGYPAEMLELGMDMEADLGIDSIKRVEIFGAMTESNPAVQGVNPQELAELRTLQQIVDYIAGKSGATAEAADPAPVAAAAPASEKVEVAAPSSNGTATLNTAAIEASLMEVIAEKTGYPAEMLELGMDMEADLGIDSIKRVEIFGAMTESNPAVQGVNPQELAELRTLQQIVDYIAGKSGATAEATAPTPVAARVAEKIEVAAPASNGAATLNTAAIEASLMEVIAEKTGYPAEMLELGMDMEADLGIDSIKRVEIFGAMTESNPAVQGVNPQELAELRTLQQIVDYIAEKSGAEKKKSIEPIDTPKDTTPGASNFAPGHYPEVPRMDVKLKYIPKADRLERWTTAPSTLICNEGTKLTQDLCEALTKQGHKVVMLNLPKELVRYSDRQFPKSVKIIDITEISDAAIANALQGLDIHNAIYLHPHFRFPLGKLGMHFDREKALVKAAFLLAKHIKPQLENNSKKEGATFMTVSRLDGAMGTQNPGNVSVVGGGLFGLTKTLNLEWQDVFCRAIDLSPALNTSLAANKIIEELYDADRCMTEAAYNEKAERYTIVAAPSQAIITNPLQAEITPESVFLVSGGGRGVTADCVREMAANFKCKFILVGRSKLEGSEPAWAQGHKDAAALKREAMMHLKSQGQKPLPKEVMRMVGAVQAQREIKNNIAAINATGSQAHYIAADIQDAENLKAALAPVVAQTGAITGMIHGAGILADKLIENKTVQDFDRVYDVKIQGLLSMIQAVELEDIKHVVFFSSVAGFYGNVGQSDYAIANEILNRVAHLFKKNHPEVHISSINWGAWDGGMVSDGLKKMFEAHGVSLVPGDQGPAAMCDQLSTLFADQPQVILGGTLPMAKANTEGDLNTYKVSRNLKEEENQFLSHHMIKGNAVMPIVNASAWMAQTASDLYPGFRISEVKDAKLFKGIVFDGSQKESYQLVVEELEKNEDQIIVTVLVQSEGNGALPSNHYRAEITLISTDEPAPKVNVEGLKKEEHLVEDASVIYTDGTLFHGTDFQGVKSVISLDENSALFYCEHPGVDPLRQGQFPVKELNAYLTDIMYQSLLVWVRRYHGCASLPLRTESTMTYSPLPFGKPFYVQLEILKSDDFAMEADITAFDPESGEVYMKSHRASVTISRELAWV